MSLMAQVRLERGDFELDVELGVQAGHTLVLLGPNGSGKSTLVEALAGLVRIDEGEIILDGQLLERPRDGVHVRPQRRSIGVMFQGLWLFPHMTVRDNVAYGLWAQGMRRRRARRQADPLLERLGLSALADRRPRQLSGGEAQRVALARALSVQPRLLLLDEPLSALDLESRPRTRSFLQLALREFGGVRLVVTHDPLEAQLLGDHLMVLENGRVAQSGPVDEVRKKPRTPYIATLAGVNLLCGRIEQRGSQWRFLSPEGELEVELREPPPAGATFATIHPAQVKLGCSRPEAPGPNVLRGRVESLQLEGHRILLRLATKPPLLAEISMSELSPQELQPGTEVWAVVPPAEIEVYAA